MTNTQYGSDYDIFDIEIHTRILRGISKSEGHQVYEIALAVHDAPSGGHIELRRYDC